MEIKILYFQFGPVCANQTHHSAATTVLEATKMKPKSSMNDGVHKNGAAVKNVKRCQPVKNVCAVMKFRQLKQAFHLNSKQDSPGLQLLWKFPSYFVFNAIRYFYYVFEKV